jgi:hypothetical protein
MTDKDKVAEAIKQVIDTMMSRVMKKVLSVSVPVIQMLVQAIMETGCFHDG